MIPLELETEILAQEELMAKIIKARSEDHPKGWWETAGIVPAATAILTVLVTSVATYYAQKSLGERNNAFAITAEDRRLARDAAAHASTAVASQLKMNDERLLAATGGLRKLDRAVEGQIADSTNRLQQAWRRQREEVETEFFLVFDSASGVLPAWKLARAALDTQTVCIEREYYGVVTRVRAARSAAEEDAAYVTQAVCKKERAMSDTLVAALRARLQQGYNGIRPNR